LDYTGGIMQNKNSLIWTMLIVTIIMLGGLTYIFVKTFLYNPIKYEANEGAFSKSIVNTMTATYTSNASSGFYASLDFELNAGKVDWEIVNPKDKTIYRGYVVFENGTVFRELIYSTYPLNGGYPNSKEEVKNEIDKSGKTITIPDFAYLQFDYDSIPGDYKLILKPSNAEGSYRIEWSDKLPRK